MASGTRIEGKVLGQLKSMSHFSNVALTFIRGDAAVLFGSTSELG